MLSAALLLSLAACSEQVEETFPTWAEAQRAGAVDRGWLPAFVPSSARQIEDTHDLDSNRQTLQFTAPPSDVSAIVEGLGPVLAENESGAADLLKKHGFSSAAETYVRCSRPLNGALVVERASGRVVYSTTAEWPDAVCAQAEPLPAGNR
jgi:hypothetical protein